MSNLSQSFQPTPAEGETLLQMEGVEKIFRQGGNDLRILQGISLRIRAGEIAALVGPSGSGKSTLLQIAGLLDRPTGGKILFQGGDVAKMNDGQRTKLRRAHIGFVYQFHHLLPEFSAIENVMLPQLANGVTRRDARLRAVDLLARVGLDKRGHHRPAEMSGGEQQRVAFCRAMANAPHILLADEPTGNLDPATSDQVFGVLMDLVRETGLSALIATHNLELAGRMDRVLRLNAGRIATPPS